MGLFLLTVLVFSRTATHREFSMIDDAEYVTQNPVVASGLDIEGVAWAFGVHAHGANWHPTTWLSHMLDVTLFGLAPGGHKAVNVLLHATATVAFFLALVVMTGLTLPSLVAASWFGLHPLRVESVVWVSERKDVLAALFWMATVLLHALHARFPSRRRWIQTVVCFALGLTAKGMLVTLPAILFFLDHWPLRRTRTSTRLELIREKGLLFALAGAVALLTLFIQQKGMAVASLERFGLAQRLAAAFDASVTYLHMLAVPVHLSQYHPHPYPSPESIDSAAEWIPAGIALVQLGVVSAIAFVARHRFPALAVGWLWYGVALLPVIGLIQVGTQGMAERYTYLPSAGIAIALAFPLWQLAAPSRPGRLVYSAASAVLVLGFLAPRTFRTVDVWASNHRLYRESLASIGARGTPDDGFLHRMLAATYLADAQRPDRTTPLSAERAAEALDAARTALRLRPADPAAHSNHTDLLIELGRHAEAEAAADDFLRSAQSAAREDFVAIAHHARGVALSRMHRYAEARAAFEAALRAAPDFGLARESLAWAREAEATSLSRPRPGP